MPLQKSTPAYKGARFDSGGFCLVHRDVRLCRLTSEGRYKIVRKTCYKCGSTAPMADPHVAKTTPHGYRKKAGESRYLRRELFENAESDGRRRWATTLRGTGDKSKDRRRARTLSPRRSRTPKPKQILKKPLSASHVVKVTGQIPMNLKPPFCVDCSKGGRGSQARLPFSKSNTRESQERSMTSEGVGRCCVHPDVQLGIRRTARDDGSWQIIKDVCPRCFPSRSTCASPRNTKSSTRDTRGSALILTSTNNASPNGVKSNRSRLMTPPSHRCPVPPPPDTPKNYSSTALVPNKEDTLQKLPNGSVPEKTVPRLLQTPRSTKFSSRGIRISPSALGSSNKNSPNAVKSNRARVVTPPAPRCLPFPSHLDVPKDYFSTALVPNKEHTLQKSPNVSVPDKTIRSVLQNSTARMARAYSKKKEKRAESEEPRRGKAFEAWESLPVHSVNVH